MKILVLAAALAVGPGLAWGQTANDLANLQQQMGKPFDPQFGRMKALTFHAFAVVQQALDNIKYSGVTFDVMPQDDEGDYGPNPVVLETTPGGVPIAVDNHGTGEGHEVIAGNADIGAIDSVFFKPTHGTVIWITILAYHDEWSGGCWYGVSATPGNPPSVGGQPPYFGTQGLTDSKLPTCDEALNPAVDAQIQPVIQNAIYADLKAVRNN